MASAQLLTAIAFDKATFEEEGLADPVIRTLGELPASSQPFHLNRVYKGPQGVVEESVLLVAPDGRTVVWQRPHRKIELRGEMFEDLFRVEIAEKITLTEHGEHTLVFLVDGQEAGRIPVWVEAEGSVLQSGALPDVMQAGLSKSSIVWLGIPQLDGTLLHRPAWYVHQGQKLYLVKGGQEQELPNLENADEVSVSVKGKDVKAIIGTAMATTRVVANDTDEFDRVAQLGMGTRLNLKDGEDALVRWRNECTMVELTLKV